MFFYCSTSQFHKSSKDFEECIFWSKGDINYRNITSKNTEVKNHIILDTKCPVIDQTSAWTQWTYWNEYISLVVWLMQSSRSCDLMRAFCMWDLRWEFNNIIELELMPSGTLNLSDGKLLTDKNLLLSSVSDSER